MGENNLDKIAESILPEENTKTINELDYSTQKLILEYIAKVYVEGIKNKYKLELSGNEEGLAKLREKVFSALNRQVGKYESNTHGFFKVN